MSAVVCNCALDIAFERWKQRLTAHGVLISEDFERLTNTRYADDILLYVKSLVELEHMATMLIEELNLVGLKLNASKPKVLHLGPKTRIRQSASLTSAGILFKCCTLRIVTDI